MKKFCKTVQSSFDNFGLLKKPLQNLFCINLSLAPLLAPPVGVTGAAGPVSGGVMQHSIVDAMGETIYFTGETGANGEPADFIVNNSRSGH